MDSSATSPHALLQRLLQSRAGQDIFKDILGLARIDFVPIKTSMPDQRLWLGLHEGKFLVIDYRPTGLASSNRIGPFWLISSQIQIPEWALTKDIVYCSFVGLAKNQSLVPQLDHFDQEDLAGTPWQTGISISAGNPTENTERIPWISIAENAAAATEQVQACPVFPREKFASRYLCADPETVSGGYRTRDTSPGKRPKFSIITVVRNAEKFIEQTIQSVLAQSFQDFEYMIIDALSTDRTLAIIKSYEDLLEYWLSEQDDGLYDAMNKGIGLARGEYVILLNAGDVFYTADVLQAAVLMCQNCDAVYGITRYSNGRDMLPYINRPWYRFAAVGHPSAIIALHLYKKLGLYYPQLKVNADAEMMFRIEGAKPKLKIIESKLNVVFYRAGGYSDQNIALARMNELIVRLIYSESISRSLLLYAVKSLRSKLELLCKFDIFRFFIPESRHISRQAK